MPICHIYNSAGVKLVRFDTEQYHRIGRIMVGRSSSCTVSLKAFAESFISREHFLLERRGQEWTIIDRSHIGIVKDTKKIKEATIAIGDVFRFGHFFLCVGEKTGPSKFNVRWEAEDGAGSSVLWPGVNSIGSSSDNYVSIRLGEVSRFHARITVLGDQVSLENRNKRIKTFINGKLIEPEPVSIDTGTGILLGDIPIRLEKVKRTEESLPIGDFTDKEKDLSTDEILALQRKNKSKAPFIILCLLIISIGLLAFLMIMLYVLIY